MRSIFTLLLPLAALSVSTAGVIMRPYLQALTPPSVYVLVESDLPDVITV